VKPNANIFILGSHDWVLGAGPILGPKEAEYVLQRTWGVHRFSRASSMERLPIEEAIAGTMQQYKAIQIAG
jgi:predicted TIM-barrel enzyme